MTDDAAAASMDAIIASIRDGMKQDIASPPTETETHDPEPVAPVALPTSPASETTLEALVRSALEPLLKAWLDANLPEIVDRAARDEIARLIKS